MMVKWKGTVMILAFFLIDWHERGGIKNAG